MFQTVVFQRKLLQGEASTGWKTYLYQFRPGLCPGPHWPGSLQRFLPYGTEWPI